MGGGGAGGEGEIETEKWGVGVGKGIKIAHTQNHQKSMFEISCESSHIIWR